MNKQIYYICFILRSGLPVENEFDAPPANDQEIRHKHRKGSRDPALQYIDAARRRLNKRKLSCIQQEYYQEAKDLKKGEDILKSCHGKVYMSYYIYIAKCCVPLCTAVP